MTPPDKLVKAAQAAPCLIHPNLARHGAVVSLSEHVPCILAAAFAVLPECIDAAHLERQREWSGQTFGPGTRLHGVLDHIRKELAEIEADPTDLGEWVDVLILAFDGAWRAGWEPQQIIDAIKAKQVRNEARTWPDWRNLSPDQAIEHDRTVPDAALARELGEPT